MKKLSRQTRMNLVFLAVLAVVLAVLFGWRAAAHGKAGHYAELQYGADNETERIPLDTDATYDIDTGFYTIHLRVEDGGIAFVDSPCPDHLCEGFGVLRNAGDWAACLPARASVTVVE